MKRALLIATPLILLAVSWLLWSPDRTTPQFFPVHSFQSPRYTYLNYGVPSRRPIAGGRLWLSLHSGTNSSSLFLFDIDQRTVVGELQNATPIYQSYDQSRVVCLQRRELKPSSLKRWRRVIEEFLGPKYSLWNPKLRPQSPSSEDVLWLLKLSFNSSRPTGEFSRIRAAGKDFGSSKDFRSAIFSSPAQGKEVVVCDLDENRSKSLAIGGIPVGQWDHRSLLVAREGYQVSDFELLDVISESRSPFLLATNLTAWLDAHGIDHLGQKPSLFLGQNEAEPAAYLTGVMANSGLATNSYLLKWERRDGALKLISRSFTAMPRGVIDEHLGCYVHAGSLMPGQFRNGVYVQDLQTMKETTLVPGNSKDYYSRPRIYGSRVIYVRDQQLWQIEIDGSNNIRLFPPL